MFVPEAPFRAWYEQLGGDGQNDECTHGTEIIVRDIDFVMNIMMKCLCV